MSVRLGKEVQEVLWRRRMTEQTIDYRTEPRTEGAVPYRRTRRTTTERMSA